MRTAARCEHATARRKIRHAYSPPGGALGRQALLETLQTTHRTVRADCPNGALTPASPDNVNNCQLAVTLQRSKAFSVQTVTALRGFTRKTATACRRSMDLLENVQQRLEVRIETAPARDGRRIHRPSDLPDAYRVHGAPLPMEIEAAFIPGQAEE